MSPSASRRALRLVVRTIVLATRGVLAFVLVYALLAFTLSRVPLHSDRRAPADGVTIFVSSSGVHTDFVVPARSRVVDWTAHLPYDWFECADDRFEYLAFGWGDKGFYLDTPRWRDLKLRTAFDAVFFLSTAAVHVTWCGRAPKPDADCRPLVLTEPEYGKLVEFLVESFARDENGRFRPIDHPGYTLFDRFFEARGTYSLVTTCNAWTGAGLRRAGLPTALWTPFAEDVMRALGE